MCVTSCNPRGALPFAGRVALEHHCGFCVWAFPLGTRANGDHLSPVEKNHLHTPVSHSHVCVHWVRRWSAAQLWLTCLPTSASKSCFIDSFKTRQWQKTYWHFESISSIIPISESLVLLKLSLAKLRVIEYILVGRECPGSNPGSASD